MSYINFKRPKPHLQRFQRLQRFTAISSSCRMKALFNTHYRKRKFGFGHLQKKGRMSSEDLKNGAKFARTKR